jgi:phosphoribosylglycinamide formyltransferase-1
MKKIRIGVLVSGGGTNLQAIIDACKAGMLRGSAEVAVVISSKAGAFALERAKKSAIPGVFLDRKLFTDAAAYSAAIAEVLEKHGVRLVCLAGFLLKLEPCLVAAFPGRILNIHPALLPKFGGKGMYGHHVHEAVVAAKETESGPTVHVVDEEYDHGSTILQRRVPVYPHDTPDDVAKRVLAVEHTLYPEAIKMIIEKMSKEGK